MYERLLSLYPEYLRRDYGAEMVLVFSEDLESARREAGLPGVLRVWFRELGEFVRFAIPVQTSSPALVVPALTFAVFAVMISIEMGVALRHLPTAATLLQELPATVTIPLFSTPFIAFAVVRTSRSRTELLDLSQLTEWERAECSKSAF